jgi:hypothetical protein
VTFKSGSNKIGPITFKDNATYNNEGQRVYDIYYLDDKDWGKDLHVYLWNNSTVSGDKASVENAAWPGDANVKDTGKVSDGHKIYRYSYTLDSTYPYDMIKFNQNSSDENKKTANSALKSNALYSSESTNGSNILKENYDDEIYTYTITTTDSNNSTFYLGNMVKENSYYQYLLSVPNSSTKVDGVDKSAEIIYRWAKFENYQNPDGKTNYATGQEITKQHYWTREENADNKNVEDNVSGTMDTRCFNPSYYRLYMYIPKETQSDKSNVIRRYTNYTEKDFVKYEATNDHGAQGAIDFDSDYIVARTSVAINPDGVTTQVADMIFGENEENLETEYYNLNGIKMKADNLTPGLYIMRRGEKAVKILIK